MNLVILTPDKELFHGQVTSVNVPAIGGRFEVLKGHAPIVAALLRIAVPGYGPQAVITRSPLWAKADDCSQRNTAFGSKSIVKVCVFS